MGSISGGNAELTGSTQIYCDWTENKMMSTRGLDIKHSTMGTALPTPPERTTSLVSGSFPSEDGKPQGVTISNVERQKNRPMLRTDSKVISSEHFPSVVNSL